MQDHSKLDLLGTPGQSREIGHGAQDANLPSLTERVGDTVVNIDCGSNQVSPGNEGCEDECEPVRECQSIWSFYSRTNAYRIKAAHATSAISRPSQVPFPRMPSWTMTAVISVQHMAHDISSPISRTGRLRCMTFSRAICLIPTTLMKTAIWKSSYFD
jgi:hypothetical protein